MGPGRPIRSIPIGRRPGAAGARRLHPVVMRVSDEGEAAFVPLCDWSSGQVVLRI